MPFDPIFLDSVKKWTLEALVSDFELMSRLVLKGGNAISLAYKLSDRPSIDLDFSISDEFENLDEVKNTIEENLIRTYNENGYQVIDFDIKEKPHHELESGMRFWRGYTLEFKIVDLSLFEQFSDNPTKLTILAKPLKENNSNKFTVDISAYEYCNEFEEMEIGGYSLHVYTPRIIMVEKLRAICQQMKEYKDVMHNSITPRPRDFYDIFTIQEAKNIEYNEDFLNALNKTFDAKKVPTDLLKNIQNEDIREFHEIEAPSLMDTIGESRKEFSFYYDYVCIEVEKILALLN